MAQQLPLRAALSSEADLGEVEQNAEASSECQNQGKASGFFLLTYVCCKGRELSHCDLQMTWYSHLRNFELTFSALHGFRNGFQGAYRKVKNYPLGYCCFRLNIHIISNLYNSLL